MNKSIMNYNKRVARFVSSDSEEFLNAVYGQKVHVSSHGSIQVYPPRFSLIPKGITVRTVGPFGTVMIPTPNKYGSGYKEYVEKQKEIANEIIKEEERIKSNPRYIFLKKKLDNLYIIGDKFKKAEDIFKEKHDISFSNFRYQISSYITFQKGLLNNDAFIITKSFHKIIEFIESFLDNDKSFNFDKIYEFNKDYTKGRIKGYWSRLMKEYICEINEEYYEGYRTFNFLLDNHDINNKIFTWTNEINKITGNNKLSKYINKNLSYYSPSQYIVSKGMAKFNNDPNLGFRFEEGSIIPDFVWSGKPKNIELEKVKEHRMYEEYFTLHIIRDDVLYQYYLTDFNFRKVENITLSHLILLVKDCKCEISIWSCMGFNASLPFWYKHPECMGSSKIGNFKRNFFETYYNEEGDLNLCYNEYVDDITKELIEDKNEFIYEKINKDNDFIIEKSFAKLNFYNIRSAFKNTFKDTFEETGIIDRFEPFYIKWETFTDDLYDKMGHGEPFYFLEAVIQKHKPELLNDLQQYGLYLDILHTKIYEMMDEKDIVIINANYLNPLITPNTIIMPNLYKIRYDNSNFGGVLKNVYKNPHHKLFSKKYHEHSETYQRIKQLYTRNKKLQYFEEKSEFDLTERFICILNLFNKSIVDDKIDIDLLLRNAEKLNSDKIMKYLNHIVDNYLI